MKRMLLARAPTPSAKGRWFSEQPLLGFLGHCSEKTWRGLLSGLEQKGYAGEDISSLHA